MSAQDNRRIVEQLWAAVEAQDWDAHDRLIDDGYVQEWPQSGERIRGKANSRAIKDNYPTGRSPKLRRIMGAGDVWIMETTIDYGSEVAQGVHVIELKDGKIVRETDYFSQPFEAPAWRAQWVERM
ncbi:MAG: nuclear transport factor 2 family protein [Candidatus Dormibacteraceae bacterium]